MGPFPSIEIDFWVNNRKPGVFILGKTEEHPELMVKIEDNITSEIKRLSEEMGNTWFEFYQAHSPDILFLVECEWYHRYSSLSSSGHPEPPESNKNLKCPVKGCKFHQ